MLKDVILTIEDSNFRNFGGNFEVVDIECHNGLITLNLQYDGTDTRKRLTKVEVSLRYHVFHNINNTILKKIKNYEFMESESEKNSL